MPLYHGKKYIRNVNVKFEGINGVNTSDANIESGSQMLAGVTAYGKNGKITGTIPSQSAKTIIPNDDSQIAIQSGTYAEGSVTVSAVPTETKNITANGTYEPQDGKYFSSVSVNIPAEVFETQSKNVSPNESVQTITPDAEYDGLSSVVVDAIPTDYIGSGINREDSKTIIPNDNSQTAVSAGTYVSGDITVSAVPSETKNITANGTYTPENGKYFSSVSVNIPEEVFETQSKTISPTESQQTVSPDANYDGLSSVVINAIPSDYVGSGVVRQAAKTITPTKSVQTAIQAGSYAEGAVTVEAIPIEYIITSDATATDADIAYGKTAYVNGEKVEGVLREISSDSTATLQTSSVDVAYGALRAISEPSSIDRIYRGGSKVELDIPMEDFGDATAADVVSGKTFTSTSGLKITGTHTCPASLDTSDATAIAADIMSGKTAYVNGEKVTGTFTVDAEITAQEEKIAEQDTIIANLMTALEGKAMSSEKFQVTVDLRGGSPVECIYTKGKSANYYIKYSDFVPETKILEVDANSTLIILGYNINVYDMNNYGTLAAGWNSLSDDIDKIWAKVITENEYISVG